MGTYIEISKPIRKRHCHQCHREIKGEHVRIIQFSGGVSKYVNICKECLTKFAKDLKIME